MAREPVTDERCAVYVRMMERGHTVADVAAHFGLQPNAVHEALVRRSLPTTMKQAVRAYWQRRAAAPATPELAKG